jgi:flagellar basal body P-ring formation protein FlgA
VIRTFLARLFILVLSLAFALAVAFGLASVARAEARLRPAVTVTGANVTLADVLEGIAGGDAQARRVVLAPAPRPGDQLNLLAGDVLAAAAAAGIDARPAQGLRTIAVNREGREVPRQLIVERLQAAFAAAGHGANLAPQFADNRFVLQVPRESAASVRVADLAFDAATGRFSAALYAPANDSHAKPLRVAGRANAVIDLPVLRERLMPGDVIGKHDITWLAVPAERVNGGVVSKLEDLIGRTSRRHLSPGQPIRANEIRRPEVVAKGALVSVLFTGAGLTLSTTGQALESGGQGDVIQVMNLQSRKTLPAVVASANEVRVASRARMIGPSSN